MLKVPSIGVADGNGPLANAAGIGIAQGQSGEDVAIFIDNAQDRQVQGVVGADYLRLVFPFQPKRIHHHCDGLPLAFVAHHMLVSEDDAGLVNDEPRPGTGNLPLLRLSEERIVEPEIEEGTKGIPIGGRPSVRVHRLRWPGYGDIHRGGTCHFGNIRDNIRVINQYGQGPALCNAGSFDSRLRQFLSHHGRLRPQVDYHAAYSQKNSHNDHDLDDTFTHNNPPPVFLIKL